MVVEIEGSRASDTGWRQAAVLSREELWDKTKNRVGWSDLLDDKAAEVARKFLAIEFTQQELYRKCVKLQRLAADWLRQNGLRGEVNLIRLRCVRGIFDICITQDGVEENFEVRESILDNLLETGSLEAAESLGRLFAANLGHALILKAS